jgi:integrase/recombinase XerC
VPAILREDPFFINKTSLLISSQQKWNSLIQNFISEEITSKKFLLTIERNIRDFIIFTGKEISKLTRDDLFNYEKYLYTKVLFDDISLSVFSFRMKNLISFLIYLYRKERINFLIAQDIQNGYSGRFKIIAPKKKYQKRIRVKPDIIVNEFIEFLLRKSYSVLSTTYKGNLIHFSSFINQTGNIKLQEIIINKDKNSLLNFINRYEQMLANRVALEEIKNCSAVHYLRTINLFVEFLREEKDINVIYVINEKFNSNGTRGNDYIPSDDLIKMLDMIYTYSQNIYRDLSIFLLLIDTGCRSIELSNLKIQDINFTERTLKICSNKSGTRTLQVSKEVFDVVKDYISIRHLYNIEKSDHLFLTSSGNPITSHTVVGIFSIMNKKAFGEKKYSPKGVRHTYITNALENNHSFDKVSKIAGHKHWVSTFYYLHRSKKLLLSNTISKSPIKMIGES